MRRRTVAAAARTAAPGAANALRAALSAIAGLLLVAAPATAQGLRGELRATAAYLDYRTVVRDSVPESEVPGDGPWRRLPDGTPVVCVPGQFCYWYRAGEMAEATPYTQDLRLTAWPGWRGVSARAHLRGRLGSDAFWPTSSERVAAVELYADFERPDFRVRGGRQRRDGALGAYPFDGAAFLWKGTAPFRVELYAGRSLGRALSQTYTGSLLAEADDLAPDEPAWLFGGTATWRPGRRFSTGFVYQRELRSDRAGLYSERAALDAVLRVGRGTLEASTKFDVAAAEVNDLRVAAKTPIGRRLDAALEGRFHRPFFDLWTIWGAFSPVGYAEGRAALWYAATPELRLEASGAYRDYEDTDTGIEFAPIEGDGLRLAGGARWTRVDWTLSALARLNRGYGAYRSSIDLSMERRFGPRTAFGVYGLGTQQFTEFRFGDGRSRGVGVSGRWGTGSIDLDGRLALYRHSFENRPGYPDYDQWRGTLGLTWRFGTEPVAGGAR
jgi:hypothetical protein